MLIFELLTGYIPFGNGVEKEMIGRIILNSPPDMIRVEYVTDDDDVYDLIERLLIKDVRNRLGMLVFLHFGIIS